METMVQFTMTQIRAAFGDAAEADVSILDVGTGNGVLPLELASQGFAKVTGAEHTSAPSLTRLASCDHDAACSFTVFTQASLWGLENYIVTEAMWPPQMQTFVLQHRLNAQSMTLSRQ